MIYLLLACQNPSSDKPIDSAIQDTARPNPWERDPMFDELAETLRQEWEQLGADRAAFAIFNQDEVVYAEGFGAEADGRPSIQKRSFESDL